MNKVSAAKRPKDVVVEVHALEHARNIDDTDATDREYTLGDVAFQVGVHRVTLLRMEQTGRIPLARWRRKPQPHRVYTAAEITVIKNVVNSKGDADGRTFVD